MCVAPFKNLFLDFPGVVKTYSIRREQQEEGRQLELLHSLHEGVDC
jgi:hypothetical protein